MPSAPHVASPCTSVCILDPESELCRGCYRTMEEIASWLTMDPEARLAVLEQVAARRREHDAETVEAARAAARAARRAGRRRLNQRDR